MKLLSTVAILLLFIAAVPNQDDFPAKKGWKSLFDGKSKKGWHIYRGEATGESWQVEDGILMFVPINKPGVKTGGDLTSDEEYENYHLSLEWKISEGGNSGIIFGVKEDSMFKKSYLTGMEMQVLDNNKHPDAKIVKHRAGDLYDLISSSKETVKTVGEWNQAEVIYNNNTLQLILNGETVVSTTVGDENWDKLVAGSKFRTMKGFGTFRKGRIVLQDHGDKVWYRNIKLKQL
jgi:hypothetical protein